MVYLKILMQDICKNPEIGWDTPKTDELFEAFTQWTKLLPEIKNLQIPRCYSLQYYERSPVQLHIMVGASLKASAAVAFLRFHYVDKVECS